MRQLYLGNGLYTQVDNEDVFYVCVTYPSIFIFGKDYVGCRQKGKG
jgi:hypothetical protein